MGQCCLDSKDKKIFLNDVVLDEIKQSTNCQSNYRRSITSYIPRKIKIRAIQNPDSSCEKVLKFIGRKSISKITIDTKKFLKKKTIMQKSCLNRALTVYHGKQNNNMNNNHSNFNNDCTKNTAQQMEEPQDFTDSCKNFIQRNECKISNINMSNLPLPNNIPMDTNIKTIEENLSEKEEENDNDLIKSDEQIISIEDQQKIYKCLKNYFVFEDFEDDTLRFVIGQLVQIQIADKKYIYEKGFNGNFFFIIAKGKVNILSSKNEIVKTYNQWDCFGLTSLLCNCTKSIMRNSAQCEGNVVLYVLDGDSFQNVQRELIKFRLEEQFNFIKSVPIFESLDNIQKYNLAEKIYTIELSEGQDIIENCIFFGGGGGEVSEAGEGEIHFNNNNSMSPLNTSNLNSQCKQKCMSSNRYNFFNFESLVLIKKGSCQLLDNNKNLIKTLSRNEYIGVENLLIDNFYKDRGIEYSLIAKEEILCYQISKNEIKEALGDSYKKIILYSLFKNMILKNSFFKSIFSEKQINTMYPVFKLTYYNQDEPLLKENISNKRIILIIEGGIIDKTNKKTTYTRGQILGETLIKKDIEISPHLKAMPTLLSLECELSEIFKVLKLDSKSTNGLNHSKRINQLKHFSVFKYLSDSLVKSISLKMKKEKYKPETPIIEQGTTGDTFYLIKKGIVKIVKDGIFIREIEAGNFFGEMQFLSNEDKQVVRSASVIAKTNVTCFVLSKKSFNLIIKNNIIKKYIKNKISMENTNISLSDLYYVKCVGKGRFGNVNLVHNNNYYYALKAVYIKQSIKDNMTKYLLSERDIMFYLDHPFLTRLVKTLKDDNFCYFLMEYINGQTLSDYLSKRCMYRQVEEVKFYSAILLTLLNYLQKKCVVHRDIKPSNIMIDKNGYLKLIDFGTAKIVNDYTSSVIGTPQYTAPEVIKGKGYSLSCDYWSLGILAYEIFYGRCPFGENCGNDIIKIYKSILHDDIPYSNHPNYFNVDVFLKSLLVKKVNKRICSFETFKSMELFKVNKKEINGDCKINDRDYFDLILEWEIIAPYIPKIFEKKIGKNEGGQKFLDYWNQISKAEMSKDVGKDKDDAIDYKEGLQLIENF